MCGITGFTNFNLGMKKEERIQVIQNMNSKLLKRGQDEGNIYENNNICVGHRRLIVIDPKGGQQPMLYKHNGNTLVITYNGQIYNCDELRKTLKNNGYEFESKSDTEVLLKAYAHYGYDVVTHINGIFAFAVWDEKRQELFLARDHFGVKPLFYSIKNNEIIFASEIKALFEFPSIYPIVDEQGIAELFGIGPAHSAGTTAFKGINELEPATYMIFGDNKYVKKKYWRFKSKPHTDNLEQTCEKIEFLLNDSIEKQLVSDVPLCTFLSGGLDSSLITMYASEYYKKYKSQKLQTFSVDYKDNDKNFRKTDFQPNTDNDYIDFISNKLDTNHTKIVLDTPELADSLYDAMIARDMPGMADVDSSLLLFCKNVKPYATVALTGECADEIFAGYPWFFREDALKSNTFPWSINIEQRQHLLNPSISEKVNLKEYIDFRYNNSLNEINYSETDDSQTREKKKISYLTMNWFMQTLLDRSDRMAMYYGVELRVPFCDYRIADYLWNIPWKMKAYNGREKGLLRHIMKGKLPDEIVERKKSPYPKTWNPTYTKKVKTMLTNIMNDEKAPMKYLLNEKDIRDIIDTEGKSFTRPWFGQLMTGPQLMAYLCQVNMWLETYKPIIEI